jgi:hypothetical protein
MNQILIVAGFSIVMGAGAAGCATSGQEQQHALRHQQSSDIAASNGQYGIAGSEERKAEKSHHAAAVKAIDEGNTIPPQPQRGDQPAPQ